MRLRSPHDRVIFRLALPALGALAAEPLYVLADTAIVVSRTTAAAAKAAIALTSVPSVFSLPLAAAQSQPSAVVRHGTVLMQWFGRPRPERQRLLFECANA